MTQIDIDEWEGPSSGSSAKKRRMKTWQWVAIASALAASVAGAAWAAFSDPNNAVASQEISFRVESPEKTTLVFTVTKPKDATVVCNIEALASNYLQVGYQEITIGPALTEQQEITATITTTEQATTAVIKTCLVQDT